MKYNIIHKDTKLTLRQYSKKFDIFPVDCDYPLRTKDLQHEAIHYTISENGLPGLYYFVPYEGAAIYYLDNKEWEIVFRD